MSGIYVYVYQLDTMEYCVVDHWPNDNSHGKQYKGSYSSISIEAFPAPTYGYRLISKTEFEALYGKIEYP